MGKLDISNNRSSYGTTTLLGCVLAVVCSREHRTCWTWVACRTCCSGLWVCSVIDYRELNSNKKYSKYKLLMMWVE